MTDAATVANRIQLVRRLSNELAGHLATLPEDVWRDADRYGSGCERWKVADVVAHLISGAIGQFLSIGGALKGSPSPPLGYRRMGVQEAVDTVNSLRVSLYEDLFPEFNVTCLRLNRLMASLDASSYDTPAWHPRGVVPIATLVDYRVLELAVHGWDIRYGLDRSATLSAAAVPFLKEWMVNWLRAGFQGNAALSSPITYRFDLTDSTDQFDLVITGPDLRLDASGGTPAQVTFRCDTNTYLLFGLGRLPFARSVRRGRLSVECDQELASKFTSWFAPP